MPKPSLVCDHESFRPRYQLDKQENVGGVLDIGQSVPGLNSAVLTEGILADNRLQFGRDLRYQIAQGAID
jgi:hypothetical protein